MDSAGAEEWGGVAEFEAGEGDDVETRQDGEAALVVAGQAAEAHLPGEGALDDPAPGRSTKPRSTSRSLTTSKRIPRAAACSAGCCPG